jgi:hypothetical protein
LLLLSELKLVFCFVNFSKAKISASQPQVAMAENGDSSVLLELLIRAMLTTGASPQEVGQTIATSA